MSSERAQACADLLLGKTVVHIFDEGWIHRQTVTCARCCKSFEVRCLISKEGWAWALDEEWVPVLSGFVSCVKL
jgi:hypothetical protein